MAQQTHQRSSHSLQNFPVFDSTHWTSKCGKTARGGDGGGGRVMEAKIGKSVFWVICCCFFKSSFTYWILLLLCHPSFSYFFLLFFFFLNACGHFLPTLLLHSITRLFCSPTGTCWAVVGQLSRRGGLSAVPQDLSWRRQSRPLHPFLHQPAA